MRVAPWALTALAIVTSFTLARWYQRLVPTRDTGSREDAVRDVAPEAEGPRTTIGWQGALELEAGRLVVLLVPYRNAGERHDFRSESLRARHGVREGELFRALLTLERTSAAALPPDHPVEVTGLRVRDSLTDLPTAFGAAVQADPLLVLLGRTRVELDPEQPRQLALWGRVPRSGEACEVTVDGAQLSVVLDETEVDESLLPRWFSRSTTLETALDARDKRIAGLEARVLELEDELHEQRLAHLSFVQGIGSIRDLAHLGGAGDAAETDASAAPDPPQPTAEELRGLERVEEIATALKALLRRTGHWGLDLLSPGALVLSEGEHGHLGPVLFRMLDGRGSLVGSLAAERLRLEASRAARTITLVLEDGHESHGGERVPFDAGIRRIALDVDPEDMLARVPELFPPEDVDPAEDDGLWVHSELRRTMNELLGAEAGAGWFRLHSFAGVLGDELVFVHVEEFDREGHLERRLFADRLRVEVHEDQVVLVLAGGSYVRGDEREPFRDGRHEIHLVTADPGAWRAARLPGLFDPLRGEGASSDR